MADKLPFYQMYPADAESDENFRALNDTELGFYWRCLNHSWMNCGLPADAEERARVLRTDQKTADKHWLRVGRCFVLTEDAQRYVNYRQERERAKALGKSETAAKSARSRYERTANADDSQAKRSYTRDRARSDSDSDSDSKSSPDARATPIDADDPVETVSRWLQTYNRTLGVDMGAPDAAVCFRVARAMVSAGKTLDDLEVILQGMIARKQKPGKSWGWHVTVLESQLGGTNAARA